MPYGINAASGVFQRSTEQIFAGLPCAIIVADIIVGGRDLNEHDENLRKVLDKACKVRLKLNPQKCKFQLKEVFTEHGLRPDPAKIQAIVDFLPSEDKVELQRFHGMINYLGKFIHSTLQHLSISSYTRTQYGHGQNKRMHSPHKSNV